MSRRNPRKAAISEAFVSDLTGPQLPLEEPHASSYTQARTVPARARPADTFRRRPPRRRDPAGVRHRPVLRSGRTPATPGSGKHGGSAVTALLSEPIDAPASGAARQAFPYSVIQGGAANASELRAAVDRDPVVRAHYERFDLDKVRVVRLTQPRAVHVSYRIGDAISGRGIRSSSRRAKPCSPTACTTPGPAVATSWRTLPARHLPSNRRRSN